MLLQEVFELFTFLKGDRLSLFYQGVTHDDITDKLISLSDENIRQQSNLERIRKKVSFAISECFQNIIRHQEVEGASQLLEAETSMFLLRNIEQAYFVGSVNPISNNKIEKLREQLGSLNSLNQEELRKMYLSLLPIANFSEKGGAGLGLIEMARKSKEKFDFDFVPLNGELSLFLMQLAFNGDFGFIKEKQAPVVTEHPAKPNIESVQYLYRLLQVRKVMLLYKSDFSQDGMLPLMDMMENNMNAAAGVKLLQKKMMYVLVELFQNIIKHAASIAERQEGVLMVSQNTDGYTVFTGNYIHNKSIKALQEQLEQLNALDKDGLKLLYRQELIRAQGTTKGGAGLGLIETARYSSSRIDYKFLSVEEDVSFFIIAIHV